MLKEQETYFGDVESLVDVLGSVLLVARLIDTRYPRCIEGGADNQYCNFWIAGRLTFSPER